jgi:hypothetical protein
MPRVATTGHERVVQARPKGAGMHWARPSVNPMLTLRCAVCNDRWDELWLRIARRLRAAPTAAPPRPRRPPGLSAAQASRPRRPPRPPRLRAAPMPADRPKRIVGGRPTADHPFERRPLLRREQLR